MAQLSRVEPLQNCQETCALADIFVSYSSEDRTQVKSLIEALNAAGLTVWHDRDLTGGSVFSEEIEKELKAAKVILAIWTKSSLKSRWVADEAEVGRDSGKLVPITLDGSMPPIGFRQYQEIDFTQWDGSPTHDLFKNLLRSLGRLGADGDAEEGPPIDVSLKRNASEASLFSNFGDKKTLIFAGAGCAVFVLIALLLVFGRGQSDIKQAQDSQSGIARGTDSPGAIIEDNAPTSIAVLAFVNMSGDPENEYFSDGISEEILNALASIKSMRVAARTSAFSFKGKNEDIRQIGKTLDVANVLEGSVRRVGDRVRVTAQLVNVENGYHLWSNTYDRELTNIFAIQEEIALAITRALKIELGVKEETALAAHGTDNLEAYSEFLKGRHDLNWENIDRIRRSVTYFRRATKLDPEFSAAWGGLAAGLVETHWYAPFETIEDEIRQASETALAHDPDQIEALGAKAYLLLFSEWDWAAAGEVYSRAMASGANEKIALTYVGQYLFALGKYDEGLETYGKILERDPLNAGVRMNQGWGATVFDRPGLGLAAWDAFAKLTDYDVWALCGGASALARLGRLEEAAERIEGIEPDDDPWDSFYCGDAYFRIGEREKFEMVVAKMEARLSEYPEYGYPLAGLLTLDGQIDKVMAWYEGPALENRDIGLAAVRQDWIATDALKAHPRYQDLLKKVRLDDASLAEMGLTWGEEVK